MRLPRERRLRRQEDFGKLRTLGARIDCGAFVLNAGPVSEESQPARLGVIVAKKQIPLAVQRNRAKRLVREAFRACPEIFPQGWDVAIVVRKSLLTRSLPSLVEALRLGVTKAKRERPRADG